MIKHRTYENEHGEPVVVYVVTGSHDTSRFVHLLTRRGNCEQGEHGQKIVAGLKRHNSGRAALALLAAHGGENFLDE
jgi:hypothetical protein